MKRENRKKYVKNRLGRNEEKYVLVASVFVETHIRWVEPKDVEASCRLAWVVVKMQTRSGAHAQILLGVIFARGAIGPLRLTSYCGPRTTQTLDISLRRPWLRYK